MSKSILPNMALARKMTSSGAIKYVTYENCDLFLLFQKERVFKS